MFQTISGDHHAPEGDQLGRGVGALHQRRREREDGDRHRHCNRAECPVADPAVPHRHCLPIEARPDRSALDVAGEYPPGGFSVLRRNQHADAGLAFNRQHASLDFVDNNRLDAVRGEVGSRHLGLAAIRIRRNNNGLGVLVGRIVGHRRSVGRQAGGQASGQVSIVS